MSPTPEPTILRRVRSRPLATSRRPRRRTTSPVARDYLTSRRRRPARSGSASSSSGSPNTGRRSAGSTAAGLPAAIAAACAVAGRPDAGRAGRPPRGWAPAGVELLRDPRLTNRAARTTDGVLTACALGIAQTGTIVLDGGPGQGRRVLDAPARLPPLRHPRRPDRRPRPRGRRRAPRRRPATRAAPRPGSPAPRPPPTSS